MSEEKKNDPTKSGPVMVTATQAGTYPASTKRKEGDTFQIDHMGHFSKRWMAKMDGETAEKFRADIDSKRKLDHLTGERIASGGVHEALSVAIEQNAELSKEIVELKETIADLRKDQDGSARVAELEKIIEEMKDDAFEDVADAEALKVREETGLEPGAFDDEGEAPVAQAETEVDEDPEKSDDTEEPKRRRRRAS